MRAIGRADLAADERLAHNDGRVQHNAMLDDAIGAWTARHALDDILQTLEAADVPCGRVHTPAGMFLDPQFAARGMLEEHTLPDGRTAHFPGVVPKLSGTRPCPRSVWPWRNALRKRRRGAR